MSYSRPNFTANVIGPVTRPVAAGWQAAADWQRGNADRLRRVEFAETFPQVIARGLVSLASASLVSANKWQYTGAIFFPPPLSGSGGTFVGHKTFSYTTIRNLREWFNTALLVDGMSTANPAAVYGPVGSVFVSGAWTTTELSAIVECVVYMDSAGNAYPTIDRPNPGRCEE